VTSSINECVTKINANALNDVGELTAVTGVGNMVKPHDVILPNAPDGPDSTPVSAEALDMRGIEYATWGIFSN
jgi:hypothetical protein